MNRRKKKLIRLDMQLKVVFIALFVACFALLIQFQLGLSGLWNLTSKLPSSATAEIALQQARVLFINKFIVSVLVAIPLAFSVGILYSFRFSGPIFKFKKYFSGFAAGRWDQPVSLRDGDDLKDVCSTINTAMDLLRARLEAHHVLFQELDAFFADAGFTADGGSREQLRKLKERIASECSAHVERFPDASVAPRQQPAPELAGGALS